MRYGEQWAKILNKEGNGVFVLAYFGSPGLEQQLEEIPPEYFINAIDTLMSFKGVSADEISLIAVSKGTEAALLLAQKRDVIKVIILDSASCCVYRCSNRENYSPDKSSWGYAGQPILYNII